MTEQLFDLGKKKHEKIRDDLSPSELQDLIEEHNDLKQHFANEFQQAPDPEDFEDDDTDLSYDDLPRHPYKIYREIWQSEDVELSDEEETVLKELKVRYKSKWERYRSRFQSHVVK